MKRIWTIIMTTTACLLLCFAVPTVKADDMSGTAGDLSWNIEDNVLTIYGRGIIPNYSNGGVPWYKYQDSVFSIVIGDNISVPLVMGSGDIDENVPHNGGINPTISIGNDIEVMSSGTQNWVQLCVDYGYDYIEK